MHVGSACLFQSQMSIPIAAWGQHVLPEQGTWAILVQVQVLLRGLQFQLYAFNSYYQKKASGVGMCYFGRAACVVSQPPIQKIISNVIAGAIQKGIKF
ncbi:hypothetical protein ACFX2I_029643 [Malus domestica]